MTFAYEGTVSHGTMLAEDLIPAFMSALDSIQEDQSFNEGADSPESVARYGHEDEVLGAIERRSAGDGYYQSEDASWDLEILFTLLDDRAPPGYYFGAHEGDGSDYGFWRIHEDLSS